jgi:hypothetical protein
VAVLGVSLGGMVLTQAMDVNIAATILSYAVVHFCPDSIGQNIVALAKFAAKIPAMIPKTYSAPTDFPNAPLQNPSPSNINHAQAAIAVINAHVAALGDLGGKPNNSPVPPAANGNPPS